MSKSRLSLRGEGRDRVLVFSPIPKHNRSDLLKSLGGRLRKGEWLFPGIVASAHVLVRTFRDVDVDPRIYNIPATEEPLAFYSTYPYAVKKAVLGYQENAAEFLVAAPLGSAMLALSPGLGKSLTALLAAHVLGVKRVLIVCPKSLMYNWSREVKKWLGEDAQIYYRKTPSGDGFHITNIETVRDFSLFFAGLAYELVILDESILVKNRKADRTEAITRVAAKAKRTWLLSGAPITKYYDDLYSQFHAMLPAQFPSYWRFARTYCHVIETKWADKVVGNQEINIRKEFSDIMYVRDHSEVLDDLPEVIHERIDVELLEPQDQIYRKALDEFLLELDSGEEIPIPNKVAQLIRLQQIVSGLQNIDEEGPDSSAKSDALEDLLRNNSYTFPMLIWVHWRSTGKALQRRLARLGFKVALLLGGNRRGDEIVEEYKAGKYDVLIMGLSVGKYGHTLINTRTVIYHDRTWDSDAYVQSMARVRGRIGLKHRPVVVTLFAEWTTDSLIEMMLSDKIESLTSITNASLRELLGDYR